MFGYIGGRCRGIGIFGKRNLQKLKESQELMSKRTKESEIHVCDNVYHFSTPQIRFFKRWFALLICFLAVIMTVLTHLRLLVHL